MADEPISTMADAVAAGGKPIVGPLPGTVPGGDTGGPQTPTTGKLEDMTQPAQVLKPAPGFRDQGMRPQARTGIIGKAEDVAQFNAPHVLGEIFQTIAGGKKKEWVQTPNGPVAQYRDLKPGEMARGILAAAITGLASGYDPANRGRGPAMSSAFAAGFKGEEAAREKKAAQSEAEAQQEFKNKGIAEERQLARERNAREQQRMVMEATEHDKRMQEAGLRIQQLQLTNDNTILQTNKEAERQENDLRQSGAQQVTDERTGKVLQFPSYHDLQEQALKDPKLMSLLHDPKFDSIIVTHMDPRTHIVTIWKQPPNYDKTPVWNGVLKNPDGTPKRDPATGQYMPDPNDPAFNAEGKKVTPTVPTTRAEFEKSNRENLDQHMKAEAAKESSAARMLAAEQTKAERYKNEAIKKADEDWNKAGGDPTKIDSKTGQFVVTPADREYLGVNLNKQFQELEAVVSKSEEEMIAAKNAGVKEDSPQFKEIQARKDKATEASRGIQLEWIGLHSQQTPAQSLNTTLRGRYTDTDGKLDVDKAVSDLNATDLPKQLKDDTEKLLRVKPEPAKAAAATVDVVKRSIDALKDIPKAQIPDLLLNRVQKGQLSGKQADQIGDALGLEKGAWRKSELAEGLKALIPAIGVR